MIPKTRPDKPWFISLTLVGLVLGALLIFSISNTQTSFLCSQYSATTSSSSSSSSSSSLQLEAIRHYATSKTVPQQSLEEISVTFEVLKTRSPCNFLVFGLGHDSLMWASLNARGTTIFLEEDPQWFQTITQSFPSLQAHVVQYRTQLQDSDKLLSSYKTEPFCSPSKAYLRGNYHCKLALIGLPDVVYDTEWDLIMIDAPKGYYPEAPGRMGAIFSVVVMARGRKGSDATHVFLHDVDRKVEKAYAEEFLCRKYLVKGVGRLWHFEIPPARNFSHSNTDSSFC